MAKKTFIVEWVGDERIKLHVVSTPVFRESGFYRQTVSLNAFRRHIHQQGADAFLKREPNRRTFHVRWESEFEMDRETEARTLEILAKHGKTLRVTYDNLPTVLHADCKAFYAAIGYDPKRRKLG